ncbi:hypothetical protein BCV71DRAFT_93991 [Rhizopus microsporus]|uniref:Uncharacterized protein n=1 Tax=Rhizopus microsporus TaxID=58291 RepID=A0A1X0S6F7_RHIZD|nr:hypothetical protein BCV71DRAFT_93991 [Rhizopus microsporus]
MTHLEDQIDQYEKWLDGFIRALKTYIESVTKCHAQATNLCKRMFISGLDSDLSDFNMVDNVINKFATTLELTLHYRTQLITELEEALLDPLQKLYKQDLKSYKESKRQFEKTLDKYETQLSRYFVLSKQKEPSALREDAFQMHELRKAYVKQSTDHFVKLIYFKSQLEHILVQSFSSAVSAHVEEIEETRRTFGTLKPKLAIWKQWLDENKTTCEHQINNIKERCIELSDTYLQQCTPHRSLKRYSITQYDDIIENLHETVIGKEGYLNSRIARSTWVRKWFFLQRGWFGTMTINKQKALITLGDRVLVSECTYKVVTDVDRRFCFEITHPKNTFYLQTETEEDMHEWIKAFEYQIKQNQEQEEEQGKVLPMQPLLYPSTLMTLTDDQFVAKVSSTNDLIPIHSTTASLLTSLMIQKGRSANEEAIPVKSSNNTSNSSILSSWGVSWANLSNEEPTESQTDSCLVWPTKLEMEVNGPELEHYTLDARHRELRKLFANVPQNEIVLDAFKASYYGQKGDETQYGYSGIVYLTQKAIWFYSCTLMTSLHLCMIPLEKIGSIKIEKTVNGTWLILGDILFSLWSCTPSEIIVERLKITASQKIQDIQTLYDTIRNISTTKISNHVTTTSALFPSVTPLTIQIQQPPVMKSNSSTSTSNSLDNDEGDTESGPSAAHDALKAAYQSSSQHQQQQTSSITNVATTATTATNGTNNIHEDDDSNWPDSIPQPDNQIECGCKDHLDKVEAEVVLDLGAKRLFMLLFSDTAVWSQLNKVAGFGEPTFTEWANSQEEGVIRERTLTYMMPVSNPMVRAKETQVIGTQQILQEQDRLTYIVLVSTKTPNLPYADTFLPSIKYCITYVAPNRSKITCSLGIKWLKSVLVKSMIKSAAMKGMAETVNTLIPILQQQQQQQQLQKQQGPEVAENGNGQIKEKPATERIEKAPVRTEGGALWDKMTVLNLCFIFLCFLLTIYQFRMQRKYEALVDHPVNWKGVYLRDLQNITESQITLHRVNPTTYEMFQQDRINLVDWRHAWSSRRHQLMALELSYARERVGTLRYELLSIFRILNSVEYQLLENEYWNWLGDKKLNCDSLCDIIEQEIVYYSSIS